MLTEVEDEQLGVDHASVGAELTESWHLSAATCLAIRHHHDYTIYGKETDLPPQSLMMVSLGIVAEKLYRGHCGDTPGAEWTRAGAAAMQATGITEDDLAEFTGEIDGVLAAG